jgi:tetratricopeptide (TPR) repeat protein
MTAESRKQQIEAMLADDPSDPFLRYGLAMEYVGQGKDEEAVCQFRELFQFAPEYLPGYHQAGQALVRLGRVIEAREVLRDGVAIARKQNELHAAEEMQGLLDSLG